MAIEQRLATMDFVRKTFLLLRSSRESVKLSKNRFEIHPSALIHPSVQLPTQIQIGPRTIIDQGVILGERIRIGTSVVIAGHTNVGEDTWIESHSCLGLPPQDLSYRGERTFLKIGNNCRILSHATIHPGTMKSESRFTIIGDNCIIGSSSHVGHDCQIADDAIIENSLLAGHVQVGKGAFILSSAVHQFVRIGSQALITPGCPVSRDVIPFATMHPDQTLEMRRTPVLESTEEELIELQKAFHRVFALDQNESKSTLIERARQLQVEIRERTDWPTSENDAQPKIIELLEFILSGKHRPFCFPS